MIMMTLSMIFLFIGYFFEGKFGLKRILRVRESVCVCVREKERKKERKKIKLTRKKRLLNNEKGRIKE